MYNPCEDKLFQMIIEGARKIFIKPILRNVPITGDYKQKIETVDTIWYLSFALPDHLKLLNGVGQRRFHRYKIEFQQWRRMS